MMINLKGVNYSLGVEWEEHYFNNLIIRAKKGEESAVMEIIKKFMPYIYKMVGSLYIKGMDDEDLKQMGYISVIKCIKSFNTNKYEKNNYKKFTAYVTKAIRNSYYYQIRKISRENYNVSLERNIAEGLRLIDVISDGFDLEIDYIEKEQIRVLKNIIMHLSKDEKDLLRCFCKHNMVEVSKYAEKNGISTRTVYKRRNTLLNKIKAALNASI